MKFFRSSENREFKETSFTSPIEIPPSNLSLPKYKFGLSRPELPRSSRSHSNRSSHSPERHPPLHIKEEAIPKLPEPKIEASNDLQNFMSLFKTHAANEESMNKAPIRKPSSASSDFRSPVSDRSRPHIAPPAPVEAKPTQPESAYLKYLSTNFEPEKIDKKLIGNDFLEADEILVHDPEKTYKFKRPRDVNPLGKRVEKKKDEEPDEFSEELLQRKTANFDMDNFLKKMKPKKETKTSTATKRNDDKIRFKKIKPI